MRECATCPSRAPDDVARAGAGANQGAASCDFQCEVRYHLGYLLNPGEGPRPSLAGCCTGVPLQGAITSPVSLRLPRTKRQLKPRQAGHTIQLLRQPLEPRMPTYFPLLPQLSLAVASSA
jgi:hypothetical protein